MTISTTSLIVMGAAGAGKTTVGRLLAARLDYTFLDADDLHPPANIARMRRGEPLDDAARAPWLAALHERLAAQPRLVLACSALKAAYRRRLTAGLAGIRVVYLRADRELLARRVAARPAHHFPASLVDSQLADLEEPAQAIVVDAALPAAAIVDTVVARLRAD